MDENSCQISATVFTLANWFVLRSFLKNPVNIFHVSILNTVCLKKCSLIRVIAECDYVNLLIFLTILWSLLCYVIYNTHLLKNLRNTDCEFYFIARHFFSINFTFFSICFYYALNILTTLYRIGS